VISDIFGKSGRAMLEALIGGQRDPQVLARLADGRLRASKSVLHEALTGHFRDHHGYLLRTMLDHVDALTGPGRGSDRAYRGGDRPFRPPGGSAR